MVAELLASAVLQPVRAVHQAGFLLALPLGRRIGWKPQNRADRGVAWFDAARLLWPHTLLGAAALWFVAVTAPWALWLAVPWMGGLVLAIPFAVLTSDLRFGAWLAARGIAATPEELQAVSRAASSDA
jgi:membrane glycosyltransferase